MKRKRLLVMGFMAGCPISGVIWQHLHYIIGLQRLGHEVFYVEDSARHPYHPEKGAWLPEYGYAARTLRELAAEFGFADKWSFCARYIDRDETAGLTRHEVLDLYRDVDAILNVCGAQEVNEDLRENDRLLYIDSDPGVEQIKVDQAPGHTIDYLARHHRLFTFGENVGTSTFPVPTHGLNWLPTRQPIVTDLWRTDSPPPQGAIFTSIANWNTSDLKDMEWRGERFLWNKAPQFLRHLAAPHAAGEPFELAVSMHDGETRDAFAQNGWQLRGAFDLSMNRDVYRDYIQRSKGEFTVAKDQYVRLHTGWFSDRSACYLAAGRPVITQQTGFTAHYGGDAGLFAFETVEEVAEAVKMINADYAHHSRAAAEIAREFFEAEKVLRSLLDRAGV